MTLVAKFEVSPGLAGSQGTARTGSFESRLTAMSTAVVAEAGRVLPDTESGPSVAPMVPAASAE